MGKVHGSLARAGKVRGQTPKVAKQARGSRSHPCAQKRCSPRADAGLVVRLSRTRRRSPRAAPTSACKCVQRTRWTGQEKGGRTLGVVTAVCLWPLADGSLAFARCAPDNLVCCVAPARRLAVSAAASGPAPNCMLRERLPPPVCPPTDAPCPPLQYNRRFVNVVVGLGKKKGPNSNTV
jgi:ribosomal protein S30